MDAPEANRLNTINGHSSDTLELPPPQRSLDVERRKSAGRGKE
jgi:hypothetical protein